MKDGTIVSEYAIAPSLLVHASAPVTERLRDAKLRVAKQVLCEKRRTWKTKD